MLALRTCSALVVPATGSNAARENVPDTEGPAPVPRAEQSAYAVVAAARRARRTLWRILAWGVWRVRPTVRLISLL